MHIWINDLCNHTKIMVLISHSHRFIYIKNRKVAGTSIEAFFEKYCTKNPKNHTFHHKKRLPSISKYGIIGSIGEYVPPGNVIEYIKEFRLRLSNKIHGAISYRSYTEHLQLHRLKKYHPDYYAEYFKFCAIRNPFDQVVSEYFWRSSRWTKFKGYTFEQYIKHIDKRNYSYNWDTMAIDDKLTFDFYIRFENLEDDVKEVCKRLNIQGFESQHLPKYKSGYRPPNSKDYRKIYNEKTKMIIERIYKKELDAFGYTF